MKIGLWKVREKCPVYSLTAKNIDIINLNTDDLIFIFKFDRQYDRWVGWHKEKTVVLYANKIHSANMFKTLTYIPYDGMVQRL